MFTVAALYKFTPFADTAALKAPLAARCCSQGVKGTLLIAPEGINGTIAGTRAAIDAVLAHIKNLPGCTDLEWKESRAAAMPFKRMKVRLKREIVTMKVEGLDPRHSVGTYVAPKDWNALLRANDVVVIDTRNRYETELGTFKGAVDPGIETFGAFPDWWRAHAEDFKGKRIAMFCTGGIRCEKSTAYVKSLGAQEVLHLQGGILKYLEEVPEADSLWQGSCFVFDGRGALGHGLIEDQGE